MEYLPNSHIFKKYLQFKVLMFPLFIYLFFNLLHILFAKLSNQRM